ncbi:potassium transporter TrkA [Natrononativus amylolyticus]|uniref:potassium transporter TrkA n=1 Tax=Natrononativus amylolyticus TaxID=2963434 RepID=UPI0020CEB1D4|nr:potassium transporter TrkA [Natrononativus amylolyticus]
MTAVAAAAPSTLAQVSTSLLLDAVVRIVGFGALAGGTAAGAAVAYRWYSAEEIPEGVAVLLGISTVALWLNTKSALGDAIIGDTPLLDPGTAVYTVTAFAASAIAADGGRRLGNALAVDLVAGSAPRTVDDVSQLVRSAGRVVAVELPATIDDADGYDPVDESTRVTLAGKTLLFPRRLTDEERRQRLVARLERDYGIDHVAVDLAADGTVERLAVGSKPAGIGPTLAPGTVAVALEADPAPDASPGDAVEVWSHPAGGRRPVRLTTAELRAAAGDVATVALDAAAVEALERPGADATEPGESAPYRLVTRPGSRGGGREFVSLLRAADEAVAAVTVDGSLAGETVAGVPGLVLAIDRAGDAVALPAADHRLESGDVAFVLGRPDAFEGRER